MLCPTRNKEKQNIKELKESLEVMVCQYLDLKFYVSIGGFLRDCIVFKGFPGGAEVKASACNVGDLGSIPGSGRPPEEGNGNPLQYSCLENPMDGGAWWAKSTGSQRVVHD